VCDVDDDDGRFMWETTVLGFRKCMIVSMPMLALVPVKRCRPTSIFCTSTNSSFDVSYQQRGRRGRGNDSDLSTS
jgi:hypothetical protein